MTPVAEFTFEDVDALGPQEDVTFQGLNEVYVRLWRTLRQEPFPHQPQQALNGAILGTETILQLTYKGKPAAGFRWRLKREGKFLQQGHADVHGLSGDMKVDLPLDGRRAKYTLSVYEPAKRPRRRKAAS
jgi:hypothetical protein